MAPLSGLLVSLVRSPKIPKVLFCLSVWDSIGLAFRQSKWVLGIWKIFLATWSRSFLSHLHPVHLNSEMFSLALWADAASYFVMPSIDIKLYVWLDLLFLLCSYSSSASIWDFVAPGSECCRLMTTRALNDNFVAYDLVDAPSSWQRWHVVTQSACIQLKR